jgi:hypothetical protein
MFSKLFGGDKHKPVASDVAVATPLETFDFFPVSESRFVVPDWDRVRDSLSARLQIDDPHDVWSRVARAWMGSFVESLGGTFVVAESENFFLVSPNGDRANRVFLEYAEKTLRRILSLLDRIGSDDGDGKFCVIAFADEDQYYEYVANYYPDEGEFAFSSGMYLQAGYGHFVCVCSAMRELEPVIAHELTHALLSHLPIPAWLNEGLAVNTERVLTGHGASGRTPRELLEMHRRFWNAQTIQEFWSGKSFLRADEGNELSYDLARHIVATIAADKASFIAFANDASLEDAGYAAAQQHLGLPLEHLIAAMMGEGVWRPDPSRWIGEAERGAFSRK